MPEEVIHSAQEANPDVLTGQTLGDKYYLEERIATGGMCAVYRATQLSIGKRVAVKVLLPQLSLDPQIVKRFEQEARTASLIHHPHAINIFDFGQAPHGSPYIVMDFIAGEALSALIAREGPLPVLRVADLLGQISGALQAAHAQGIVHRDVKPGNILISQTDGKDWVTVLDFGVAKVLEDLGKRSNLTGENVIVGTPRYMSPEQAEGGKVDARSDIYSLGIALYEMLTGVAPFQDDSATQLLLKQTLQAPPPLREKRPDVSLQVERVVLWALAKDPNHRPASVAELNTAFQQAALSNESDEQDQTSLAQSVRQASRVVVPFGVTETVPASDTSQADDEATLIQTSRQSHSKEALPASAKRVASWRRGWAFAAVLLLATVILGFVGMGSLTTSADADSVTQAITDAQRDVASAQALLNKLPVSHNLKTRLAQLNEWDSELSSLAAAPERNAEIKSRAEAIKLAAGQYIEQASTALAQLGTRRSSPQIQRKAQDAETQLKDPNRSESEPDREELEAEEPEGEQELKPDERKHEDVKDQRKKKEEELKKMTEEFERLIKRN